MKKNKKLKKQFKKLLNEQIFSGIKSANKVPSITEARIVNEEPEKNGKKTKHEISKQEEFAKKDLLKTAIISSAIISLMILLAIYLGRYNQYNDATDFVLKILRAK